jgi:hypothetical protein
MARNGDRPLDGGAAPDVVTSAVPDTFAAVLAEVALEIAECGHGR